MRISDWSSDVCSSDLHLRENRALHLARAIGNRPRLALDDPEFALFGDERGECRLRLGAGVGGDAEYAIAAIDPQRPDRKSVVRDSVCQYMSVLVLPLSLKNKTNLMITLVLLYS